MNSTSPSVSIILPTYNREHLIGFAIQSVLNQTYSDFELIIIDDYSQDKTDRVVETFNDVRIQYIKHDHNSGVSVARNTGIEQARGKYIAFLDSDDEWLPEKLEKQLQVFSSESTVAVVYSWLQIQRNSQDKKAQIIRSSKQRGDIYGDLLYTNFVGTPSTVIVKRECFDSGIRFDPSLRCCEDWDVWLKLAQYYQFEVILEPLVKYREHPDINRGSINSHAVIEGHLQFLNKHHFNLHKHYYQLGDFSNSRKAGYLFNIGRRLLCHGNAINSREAVQVGRQYLWLAVKISFLRFYGFYFFVHYLAALVGSSFYIYLHRSESETRSLLSGIVNHISLRKI